MFKIIIGLWIFLLGSFAFGQENVMEGDTAFYHPNGRIASEGKFENNLPEGIWKSYYSDGTLKSVGLKTNGKSDSIWVFYDIEGRKRKKYTYRNDLKNGCAVFLDTMGNVTKELFFIDDVAQGEEVTYYADGTIKSFVNVKDGKPEGTKLEYANTGEVITVEVYDNGYLKERNEYNRYDEEGRKTGVWRDHYPDGTIKSEIAYKAGEKSGLAKTYNKKGKLIDLKKMQGDTLAGHSDELVIIEMYREKYEDGSPKLVGGIDQGMKTGIFRAYDRDGNIINGFIYRKDTMVAEGIISAEGIYKGDWKYYYKDGQIKSSGAYVDGKKDGKWVFYYPDGKKEQEGTFNENKLKGQWTWYYHNGQIKRSEYYNRKEELEGTVYEYDSLGNELTRGDYYNGQREGEWFYHVGDYKETGAYTIGMKTGIWKSYYLNGKLAFKGAYDEGEAIGKHIYYHRNGIQKQVGKYLGGEKHGKWKAYNRMGEKIQVIEYRYGVIYRIDGVKVNQNIEDFVLE